jgi:hypothetical protein
MILNGRDNLGDLNVDRRETGLEIIDLILLPQGADRPVAGFCDQVNKHSS